MKKKFFTLILGIVLVTSLTGCKRESVRTSRKASASSNKTKVTDTNSEITFVFAEVNPLDTVVGQTDSVFKDKVEELSGGKIKIDIQADGCLGSENDVLDSMLSGDGKIDMSRTSAFSLTSYGGEKSKLLSIPYTFVNREHYWNFATSDLAQEFLMEPYENKSGVRGLFYGEEGFRHFFTVKDIKGIEDLKGMKLRVSNDPIMNGMVEGLGASPVVVDFGELSSALQSGKADGAEQPLINYKANEFQKVAPNVILDGHTLGAIQVIITDDAWDSLTDNQQDIIMEASKYASEYNRKISADADEKALKELKEEGVNIIEVNDIQPWKDACKEIIESSSKYNQELYKQILDMQ